MVMRFDLAPGKARANEFRPLTPVESNLDLVRAPVGLPRDFRKIDYDFLSHDDLLGAMLSLWPMARPLRAYGFL